MSTDPHLGSRAALGSRCKELMQSPVFIEAMTAVNDEYERAILGSKPDQGDKRAALFLEYHALKRVVHRLKSWETDGNLAKLDLDKQT